MASGLPNTDPRKGRPTTETSGKGGAETKAMMDSFDGVENAVVEQLALIAGFTEIMKNYIPKLGFIDAHTQALKLKQDQAFKVLEKIEGHLAKQAEIVDDGPEDGEPDADAEDVLPDEEVGGGGGEDIDYPHLPRTCPDLPKMETWMGNRSRGIVVVIAHNTDRL